MCPSWGRAIGASGAVSAPQAETFEIELRIASAARFRDDSSSCVRVCSPAEMTPLCSMPCFSCSAASLRAALCELLSTRERHRASRSLAPRLARGTHESAVLARASRFLLKTFFPPLPLPGAAGFKKHGPTHRVRGIACTVLERTPSAGAGRHPPPRRGSAAGTLLAPQAEIFRGGAGGGRFGGHMGRCGPKNNFLVTP